MHEKRRAHFHGGHWAFARFAPAYAECGVARTADTANPAARRHRALTQGSGCIRAASVVASAGAPEPARRPAHRATTFWHVRPTIRRAAPQARRRSGA